MKLLLNNFFFLGEDLLKICVVFFLIVFYKNMNVGWVRTSYCFFFLK